MKFDKSLASAALFAFVDDPFAFLKLIDLVEDEYFLLLPAGGNRVNLVHNCFKASMDNPDDAAHVFGILGSRRSSPFKCINVGQAVRHQEPPRATRSEERKETLAPSMREFAKCKNADEFRDSVSEPGEGGYSNEALGKFPSSCFVHRSVFEAFGKEGSMRAGELAMRSIKSQNLAQENEVDPIKKEEEGGYSKKGENLLLFLWSVENHRMSKVSLKDPPDNDIFDSLAQKAMRKLDKEDTKTEGTPDDERNSNDDQPTSKNHSSNSDSSNSPSLSVSRSRSPKDRIKSQKPSPGSPYGSPLAKFYERGREKGRREGRRDRKGRREPSPTPSHSSDSNDDSDREISERSSSEQRSPKTPRSKPSRALFRSEGKSPMKSRSKSRSRSSKTKSYHNDDSDSSSGKSLQTRKSRSNKSPPSSSSESSSSDSDSSDDSGSSRPSARARRPTPKKRRRKKSKRESRRKRAKASRGYYSSSDEETNLHKAMVRSLEAMTSSQIKRDQREDNKKSMLSRLSPEGGSLFKLLSAKNWKDGDPKLPAFTKKILEDRDSQRALGEMKSLSKRWTGKISEKGILSFLANGYAADDISEAPGGFSIFMFSPLDSNHSSDQKSRILQVKSMFGSSELDEDSIKYFAKNDFYLAGNLSGLEEQIFTCIKLLETLTCKSGIASEGYWHGLNMLSRHKREFLGLTSMDPLFPVKFAYLLDRAFQNFVLGLGDYHDKDYPILRARRAHKGQQVRDIEAAMSGFKTGSLSQLFLPRTLQSEPLSRGDHPSKGGGSSKTGGTKQRGTSKGDKVETEEFAPEDWWSKNPNPVAEWQIPNGKAYNDYFDFYKEPLRANTMGWPKIASHDPRKKGKQTYLCMKYQCVGSCSNKCGNTHVDPEKLSAANRKIIDDRMKVILG